MNLYPDHERIQRLRTARGLTQAELAQHLDLSTGALSRALSGHQQIDPQAVVKLARLLDCEPEVLARKTSDTLYTRPWLRAYADAPKKVVEQYVADSLLAIEAVEELSLKRLPERLPAYSGDLNDEDEIENFAGEVRAAADVSSSYEVPNVTRAAERLGCVVLPMDSELGKHLGMSLFVDGAPVIRVSRPSGDGGIPGDRQRFTTAHELGHVTLHSSCPPPDSADQAKEIEKQAHRFAAAFLLPGDSFLDDLDETGRGRVTLSCLAKMKERWGVSVKAMVVRLQHLNRIDADQARSLYKQISARGWNKIEPVQVDNERAIWLSKALFRRAGGEDPIRLAASRTGLNSSYFASWTDWEASKSADVIDLETHRASR